MCDPQEDRRYILPRRIDADVVWPALRRVGAIPVRAVAVRMNDKVSMSLTDLVNRKGYFYRDLSEYRLGMADGILRFMTAEYALSEKEPDSTHLACTVERPIEGVYVRPATSEKVQAFMDDFTKLYKYTQGEPVDREKTDDFVFSIVLSTMSVGSRREERREKWFFHYEKMT